MCVVLRERVRGRPLALAFYLVIALNRPSISHRIHTQIERDRQTQPKRDEALERFEESKVSFIQWSALSRDVQGLLASTQAQHREIQV